MTIDFYYLPGSAPCRAVLMTAKALGLEMNLKLTNLMAGEHMTPEFLKLNPQHTIPTLVDDSFTIWESRAIITYLCETYGSNNSSIYPGNNVKLRGKINQLLFFDMGTLYQAFGNYWYPQLFGENKQLANPENEKKMYVAVGFLDKFLENVKFAAGTDTYTIADITMVATISTYACTDFDFTTFKNVLSWYDRCKEVIPGYDENQAGVAQVQKYFKKRE